MLKTFIGLFMITCLFALAGCGSDKPTTTSSTPPETSSSPTAEVSSSPASQSNVKISKIPGIGSTEEDFSKAHKISNDNGMMKVYDNQHIAVVFADGRALNITVNADKNHKRDKSIEEMIPSDATNITKTTDESDELISKEIQSGSSKLLAEAIPDSKGQFKVIDLFDKKTDNYLHTIIDATPSM